MRFLPYLLGFVLVFSGCPGKSVPINSLSVLEVQGLLNNAFVVLVDVREEVEVQASGGVIESAKHFPASRAAADPRSFEIFVNDLPRDKQVVFYAGETVAGASMAAKNVTREEDRLRVRKMAEFAQENGVRAATLNGGFHDWKR
ncbi:MAG: rhodanese-like domain-containing protein [Bdellovibrionota bacterium]